MLIMVDASALEWRVAAHLSGDTVAINEIINKFDTHSDNQSRFGLPERRIAKVLLFRILYGGSAYAFSVDPDFMGLGNERYWQRIIDKLYEKYTGLANWHTQLVQIVNSRGYYQSQSGRIYQYTRNLRGEFNRPEILNYPVKLSSLIQ